LATFGLTFVIQGSMLALFGGAYYSYSYLAFPVQFLGETVAANRLAALGITILLGLVLYLALTRTRAGTAVRAVAVDPFAAQLVAINVPQASALTFALGGALVAAAGVLVSTFLTFSASSGVVFPMKALIVVGMGGVGNMLGCLVAGLALGLSEALVASYVDPGLTLAVNFALFLAVLLVKPAGLFGRATRCPREPQALAPLRWQGLRCWLSCRVSATPTISRSPLGCCSTPCWQPPGACS